MRVVTGSEMHQIDRFTIDEIGLGEEVLMESAGRAVFFHLKKVLEQTEKIAVLIGAGNNGGDGFVIARYLLEDSYDVDVWVVPKEERIKGTARYHMNAFKRAGYEFKQVDANEKENFYSCASSYTVIIDSLLGTGIKGSVREPYNKIISFINELKDCKVIAVDLPSGVSADSGELLSEAVSATSTITLQCPKIGAFLFPAAEHYGTLQTVNIGIPNIAIEQIAKKRYLWDEKAVRETFPVRKRDSHKSTFGKGLIIAGSKKMTGAAVLAAKACHRAGAGLVTLATPNCAYPVVANQVVEATFAPCPSEEGELSGSIKEDWGLSLSSFHAVAIGPGIGRSNGVRKIVEEVLSVDVPLLVDADGLYHLSALLPLLKERQYPTVLTPHAGEMARLLGCSVDEVEKERFSVSEEFAKKYNVYLVLKGPYTIVTTPSGQQYVNRSGNPALAKGGSGDVLTGMLLAFLMQHETIQAAISNGVFLHGKTADLLVERKSSPYDVLASDLINYLPYTFRSIL